MEWDCKSKYAELCGEHVYLVIPNCLVIFLNTPHNSIYAGLLLHKSFFSTMLQLVNIGIKHSTQEARTQKRNSEIDEKGQSIPDIPPIPTVLNVLPFSTTTTIKKTLEYCLGSSKSLAN